jgi:hypothetical protein
MARTGRYEAEAPHIAGVGANRPRVRRRIIQKCLMMAAANCSPAAASRRAKYEGDRPPERRARMARLFGHCIK